MAATLYVTDYFSVVIQGNEYTGKQGEVTDNARDGFAVTVDGGIRPKAGTIASEDEASIWEADMVDFVYMHLWTSGDAVVQLIGSGASVCFPVVAMVPFILGGSTFLAVADDTEITGSAAPSLVEITSIILANYDDEDEMDYVVSFIH